MAVLDIKIIPDPILRSPTKEVGTFDARLHKFLEDMYETMVSAHGLGLAAPQIGEASKVAIIDLTVDEIGVPAIVSSSNCVPEEHIFKGRLELINATILEGGKKVSSDEGCLSIPEYRDSILRHNTVTASAVDRHGRKYTVQGSGLLAFAMQHEIDHLNGILFTDHLSRLKKQLFQRWCVKNIEPLE
jgi:peptide deformylase